MSRHRVAIVGAGIGREHLDGYLANVDSFNVTTICDLDAERAEPLVRVARAQGSDTAYAADLGTVLDDESLDIVDICLPPQLHRNAIIAALARGKHVVCEKPLVASLAEIDEVTHALAQTDRLLMPVFQYRFGNGLATLLELLEAGLTGKPLVATLETHWNRLSDYYDIAWRGKWATELGGAIVGHAIHAHDLLLKVFGPVASVQAELATRVNVVETEDCAALVYRMQSGALATSSVTLGGARDHSRLRFCFEHLTAESSLEAYNPATGPWTFEARGPEVAPRHQAFGATNGDTAVTRGDRQAAIDAVVARHAMRQEGYAGQFARFAEALGGQAPLPVCLDDARASLELITAIYEANATGQRVTLPVAPDSPGYEDWSAWALQGTGTR